MRCFLLQLLVTVVLLSIVCIGSATSNFRHNPYFTCTGICWTEYHRCRRGCVDNRKRVRISRFSMCADIRVKCLNRCERFNDLEWSDLSLERMYQKD
ncbi:hypothetical protein LSAT2_015815 [Lamellibrachia satsuma]|nr:hypothetical protein LSAT2_015815 [Lamellibrachia satsuma]